MAGARFLVETHGAEPLRGLSPAFRNHACDAKLPLATMYEGRRTLWELFLASASAYPENSCLGHRQEGTAGGTAGPYVFQSYRQVHQEVEQLAAGLMHAGLVTGSRVCIYGANSPSWIKAMLATSACSTVCVPLYDTLGPHACGQILEHSGAEAVFVQDQKVEHLLTAIQKLRPALEPAAYGDLESAGAAPLKLVVVWGSEAHVLVRSPGFKEAFEARGIEFLTWPQFLAKQTDASGAAAAGSMQLRRPDPEDLATIMYTSGTTGMPKGVMLTHRALVSTVASQVTFLRDPLGRARLAEKLQRAEHAVLTHTVSATSPPGKFAGGMLSEADEQHVQAEMQLWPQVEPEDKHLSYLPLAHIYERALLEAALAVGAGVGCWQGDVDKLQDDAAALKPSIFVGVPRVWERVKEGVDAKLASRPFISRWVFNTLFWLKRLRLCLGASIKDALAWGDRLAFMKVRAALGGHLKLCISGAAPLPLQLEEFMRVTLCCYAGQGYGLTETCSATCVAVPTTGMDMWGTVGPIQTCAEMRLMSVPELQYDALAQPPQGELLIRGPCLFSGYYKDQEATDDVLDDEGWFHTGDIVEMQASGALKIIDRRKNMIKLAQGEYVPVAAVETALLNHVHDLVEALWVHGDSTQRRVVAVVVPRPHALLSWWQSTWGNPPSASAASAAAETEQDTFAGLCASEAVRREVLSRLKDAATKQQLPAFQHPAAVHLEPLSWTPESGLLTPTHKLKRHALEKHYRPEVDQMYLSLGRASRS